jgi:hypothetical protein
MRKKTYEVIGCINVGDRLILQDPQKTNCELIVGLNNSVKPLLRKMDSMKNDEKEKYQSLLDDVKYERKRCLDCHGMAKQQTI